MGGVAGLGSDRDLTIACTGESIASSQTFMRGHGSYLDQETSSILSSVCGTVERVNKLVSVRPVRTRYSPEVGDLVVGRVTEVGPRRWKVDIGSKSDAALLLSSVNLPGGVQRRKLESDELQMRNFFQEGDLLVAEVQSIFHDGSVGLHTRSLRYGKLRNGSLVRLAPVLIQRLKSHFLTLPNAEVDIVLGLNGYVWVAKHIPFDVTKAEGEASGKGIGMDIDGVYSDVNEEIPIHVRRSISRVSHLLKLLASYQLPISDVIVQKAYDFLHSFSSENLVGG
ncbi:hypothetical protein IE53DRAFT_375907 [Violaceomyces palustris]|uniref:Uncharacterized protein n=1 Tax=Violaceomyces palustris TaxID=1673888 RepID=A0ACD0NPT5_9BASI|nr:hypothetical protein IE53DRAFT_375907 [Violaceomyces palustris]